MLATEKGSRSRTVVEVARRSRRPDPEFISILFICRLESNDDTRLESKDDAKLLLMKQNFVALNLNLLYYSARKYDKVKSRHV